MFRKNLVFLLALAASLLVLMPIVLSGGADTIKLAASMPCALGLSQAPSPAVKLLKGLNASGHLGRWDKKKHPSHLLIGRSCHLPRVLLARN